jgi:hypothetical protein
MAVKPRETLSESRSWWRRLHFEKNRAVTSLAQRVPGNESDDWLQTEREIRALAHHATMCKMQRVPKRPRGIHAILRLLRLQQLYVSGPTHERDGTLIFRVGDYLITEAQLVDLMGEPTTKPARHQDAGSDELEKMAACRNPESVRCRVVNAIARTIRKLHCASTRRRPIAEKAQNKS